jgi:hypothetical protein
MIPFTGGPALRLFVFGRDIAEAEAIRAGGRWSAPSAGASAIAYVLANSEHDLGEIKSSLERQTIRVWPGEERYAMVYLDPDRLKLGVERSKTPTAALATLKQAVSDSRYRAADIELQPQARDHLRRPGAAKTAIER